MFGNFSIFHFLVYATAFGFIAATVYTNIQIIEKPTAKAVGESSICILAP